MNPWETWKKENAAKQSRGITSPLDFVNPTTEYAHEQLSHTRYAICNDCPKLMVTKQCSECLCFMPAKTKLKNAVCPLGKW